MGSSYGLHIQKLRMSRISFFMQIYYILKHDYGIILSPPALNNLIAFDEVFTADKDITYRKLIVRYFVNELILYYMYDSQYDDNKRALMVFMQGILFARTKSEFNESLDMFSDLVESIIKDPVDNSTTPTPRLVIEGYAYFKESQSLFMLNHQKSHDAIEWDIYLDIMTSFIENESFTDLNTAHPLLHSTLLELYPTELYLTICHAVYELSFMVPYLPYDFSRCLKKTDVISLHLRFETLIETLYENRNKILNYARSMKRHYDVCLLCDYISDLLGWSNYTVIMKRLLESLCSINIDVDLFTSNINMSKLIISSKIDNPTFIIYDIFNILPACVNNNILWRCIGLSGLKCNELLLQDRATYDYVVYGIINELIMAEMLRGEGFSTSAKLFNLLVGQEKEKTFEEYLQIWHGQSF